MKRFLLTMTCAFLLCYAPIAMADDGGDDSKKKAKTSGPVIVSTVEVAEEESGKEESKSTGKITIEINGKKQEFEIGDQGGNVVKKIREVIKDSDNETTVEATIIGHGLIVGPDGEKKEFKLGHLDATKEMLKNLPEEVRKQVEKAMKDSSKGSFLGQGIMIGPDGEKKVFKLGDSLDFGEALKELPKEARKKIEQALKEAGNISVQSSGRAIVIGPDGVKNEFKFGDGNLDDLDANKEMLKNLPEEVRKQVAEGDEGFVERIISWPRYNDRPSDGEKNGDSNLVDSPGFGEALDRNFPKRLRKKIEQALKDAGNISVQSSGRAIVIGPDGVMKEFKFGDGNLDRSRPQTSSEPAEDVAK